MKSTLFGIGVILGVIALGLVFDFHESQRLSEQIAQQRALLVEADQAAAALRLSAEALEPQITKLRELEVLLRTEQNDWRAEDDLIRAKWHQTEQSDWQQMQRIVLRSLDPTAIRLSAVEEAMEQLQTQIKQCQPSDMAPGGGNS